MQSKAQSVLNAAANTFPYYRVQLFTEVAHMVADPTVDNRRIPAILEARLPAIQERTLEKVYMPDEVRDEVRGLLNRDNRREIQSVVSLVAPIAADELD